MPLLLLQPLVIGILPVVFPTFLTLLCYHVKTRVLSRSVSTVSANWMDLDPFLTTGSRFCVGRSLVQAEAPER